MESVVMQRTPYKRLVFATMLGVGTSTAPLVLLQFGLIQFIIMRIVGQEHATAVYGMASGITGVMIVFFGLISGVIADKTKVKIGRRRFWIIAGSIGGALSMLSLTFANSVPMLIISWAVLQFFYGMVSLSCYALVPEQIDKEKFGRVSGLLGAAAPAFVMAGQLLIGAFADSTQFQKLITIIVVQLIGGFVTASLIKDNYVYATQNNDTEEKVEKKKIGLHGFYPSIRKYPTYTWALLTKLFVYFANAGLTLLSLYYVARFQLRETEVYQLNALTSPTIALMVLSGILGGFLSDKIKKQKPFVAGAALLSGVCMTIFAFTHNITWVIIGNFVFNFGFGLFGAVDNALINRILPSKENAAKDLSIMNTTVQLSSTLVNFAAPAMIAFGASTFGGDGYTFFFLVLAVFSILSAITVIPIPEMESENDKVKDPANG